MVNLHSHESSKPLFNEVVIVDFGPFQIAVLTATKVVKRPIFSAYIPVPERLYQSQGWLIHNQRLIAHLDKLKINPIFTRNGPFPPLHRLAPAIPVSFEVQSSQKLPPQVAELAAFVCRFLSTDFPYHTIFHNISPRYVKIYPFRKYTDLLKNTKKLLEEEATFIEQNRCQLKKVAFFQTRFGL